MATASRPRSALALGAARAGGERAKRRSTPLLSGQLDAETAAPARTSPAKAAVTKPAKAAVTKPAKEAVPTRSTAKKATASTAGASKPAATKSTVNKATTAKAPARKATPTKRAASKPTAAKAAVPTTGAPTTATPSSDAAPVLEQSRHRPRPTIMSAPRPKVARLSGERRVPRQSPRAKRAADDAAARRLRVAPSPAESSRVAAAGAAGPAGPAGPATASVIDPTRVPSARSTPVPVPNVADLVQGAITAVRFAAEAAGMSPEEIESKLAAAIAYVRRRVEGNYEVDEFGYDAHFTEHVVLPLLRPIYRNWFRVEVRGIENIPAEGGALIVANHSGTIAIDSVMTQVAVHDEHPQHRVMRALGADLVFQTPFLGPYARRTGSTLATNSDAERLFAKGELVGVFPEGFKGVGKPFSERYKLQRFGRGGFVSAALKAGVPIIPTSIVGAEEIAPIIGNMTTFARLFGLPYAPITPTFPWLGPLGLIPLPSKWIIEFGAPIPTDGYGPRADEDPMLVFDLTDQVRETIQQTLYALLMQRKSVFF